MTDRPVGENGANAGGRTPFLRRIAATPLAWLALVLLVLCVLLSIPIVLPIGPMYWDTYIYFDAAQRIYNGQIPNTDFLTPVGPLAYYIFALGLKLFPNAQPLLLAQWVILIAAAPLMAAVVDEVARKQRGIAFGLLIPFLVFAICPANVQSFQSYPGMDGFGIYNRHATLLLYVLVSALVFVKDGRKLAILCGLTMLALFLIKVTGFLAGGLIGLLALLSGRISWRSVVLAGAIFLAALVCLEFNGRMITAYIDEIALLIGMNQEALLPRFLTVLSTDFDIILASAVLILTLAWMGREKIFAGFTANADVSSLLNSNFIWLAVALIAGIFFETQNTGSQDFSFLWPILLAIFIQSAHEPAPRRLAIAALIGFVAIPYTAKIVHKTLRAVAVSPTYIAAPVTDMKTLGLVSTRRDIMERSLLLEKHYQEYGDAYSDLSSKGQLPSWQLYSELDYQMYWVITADEAVKAIKQFEATSGVHLGTIMNLDFANPFPWLLDRDATRNIQIGADPYRTVPPPNGTARQSIAQTDAVLMPHCPLTTGRRALQRIYADALQDRQVVKLNDCWDMLLRPGIIPPS